VVLTPSSAIKKTFSLAVTKTRKFKDLRHIGMEETSQSKGWTMSREIYPLNSGEEKMVSRSSQWRMVGLKDIFEFASAKGFSLYDWHKHLLSWHTYTEAKKKSIYDKECCHELNIFIKFKDPDFFDRVVSKYITNKICKTFVDYCLLGLFAAVKEFIRLDKFRRLNSFEKVLLVFSLAANKDTVEEAKRVVEMLESEDESEKKDYR
jgi:hypothetical protein